MVYQLPEDQEENHLEVEGRLLLFIMIEEIPSKSGKLVEISTKSRNGEHYSYFYRSRELKRLVK